MEAYKKLRNSIIKKKANIAVIGLGYVGLPIAIEFVKAGFNVFGLENDIDRINKLQKGESYILDVETEVLRKLVNGEKFHVGSGSGILRHADVVIVCVPTPLRKTKIPNISYIIKAIRAIAVNLKSPSLIVLESTTYPGTTRDVVMPILKRRGFREGKDFFLAFSPERIDPGNTKYSLMNVPKLVGGTSKNSTDLAYVLYSQIIKKVVCVSSSEVAEVVKLLENTFRIVNIGLINEFAMLCHKFKIDVWEVIRAAKTKPFGFMAFYPGPGIGGHCIPKDPLYLSWKARKAGFKTKMIDLASKVNSFMPAYAVERVKDILGGKIRGANILVLGVTYKRDVKDLRESPALEIIELLKWRQANVSYSDPHIPYLRIKNIDLTSSKLSKAILAKQDCIILVTDHSGFDYHFIAKHAKRIFDTRNVFDSYNVRSKNITAL
ncbi:MAG: UDP-N-acetyl-D-glucosamine dehydrogenase [Candidatus Omnitrophica bacterium CG07_land_8_20_14_0_80_42_15]|uniref:UDP-N-acetyl-D-glucosamine dehydrogenase n=1 Tax=Candidatus Aquitaenariimonas noxiae TaxID=1974741 RepID=A0A2J0KTE8_9BACT|nr:MAG: UDP-N-acetyl-D-glucosamine dehydrogenase [Candidatus Omnitrophica bacterium CG07_land_8_20_14_0_80_42_15]